MRVSYGEGVAIHTGPASCVGHREVGGEALAGARAGRVFSPESTTIGVPTLSVEAEGHIRSIARREMGRDPTGSKTPRLHGSTSRVTREIPGSPARLVGDGAQREV